MTKQEFVVAGAFAYDRRSPVRWIASHLLRNRRWLAFFLIGTILANAVNGGVPLLVGRAFNTILQPATARDQLPVIAIEIVGLVLLRAAFDLVGRLSAEIMGKRFKRDAREELFASLLGKSQTFHNRQQVGDLMARAANDVGQLSNMIVPGADAIVDYFLTLILSLVFIGILKPELLLAPLIFTVVFLIALRDYARQLAPVSGAMRGQFGQVNAGLEGGELIDQGAHEALLARCDPYRRIFSHDEAALAV